jgi:ribonuclease HI
VYAAAGTLNYLYAPLQAEAEALLKGILFVGDMGIERAIFETDSELLIKAIVSSEYDLAAIGALFREIKYLSRMGFIDFWVIHQKREGNKPAHVLAGLHWWKKPLWS